MAAHTPIANERSRASANVRRIKDKVAGIIMAAPRASRMRAQISQAGAGENAAHSEAMPNTARPARKTGLWPRRSPRVPRPGSKAHTTREYTLMIHSFCEDEACSSRVSAGKAV